MATLHLMVGLPGSGKTTEAMRLAEQAHALRLTPDEWQYQLFGNDFIPDGENTEHDRRHTQIEALMWKTAQEVLRLGVDVILDFGFWAREERDALRAEAQKLSVGFQIHYMACSEEELWRRLQIRNRRAGETPVFRVSRENLREWAAVFQPPTEKELNG